MVGTCSVRGATLSILIDGGSKMDKVTLLLGILIGAVVVLYFIPVWRNLWRDFKSESAEGFITSEDELYAVQYQDANGNPLILPDNITAKELCGAFGAIGYTGVDDNTMLMTANNNGAQWCIGEFDASATSTTVAFIPCKNLSFMDSIDNSGILPINSNIKGAQCKGIKPSQSQSTVTNTDGTKYVVLPFNSTKWASGETNGTSTIGSSSSSGKPSSMAFSSSSSSSKYTSLQSSSSSSSSKHTSLPPAPTCPPPPNIQDAVSKAISDAMGKLGGAGGSVRNRRQMNFGAAAGATGIGMPMQSPPLDMQKLIEMAKALVDPSITVDSDSVRTKFTYKYGSANSLTPTQLADVYLIYLEYPNFYYNFYSILDQSNKDVFRKSYLSEQSQAIAMINTFGMEVMIYLHQQLDPNFEADFGDSYEEPDMDDTGTCKTDKMLVEELKKCLTSTDVNCVQSVLNNYYNSSTTSTATTTTTASSLNDKSPTASEPKLPTTPPPSTSSSYIPGPTVPVGSSSSYGLVIPPAPAPATTSSSAKGGLAPGSGSGAGPSGLVGEAEVCDENDIEIVVQAPNPPTSSCPVCEGGGCDICSGTGSPSLGQGSNWKYITPQVSKCKPEEPLDMRWGY